MWYEIDNKNKIIDFYIEKEHCAMNMDEALEFANKLLRDITRKQQKFLNFSFKQR